ncbi:sulfatase [Paenibacillus glycinis]|uniref:Sulfatase-like hydrolase/transferase n=1 Tax=Paenibacillus glycinis TaxID=2697035 RepID=A0ABW9XK51_9BACL|nr:sulfatase [Paenibacillus glycinis]NBD22978.1 sulfatase-like hydrolase/transferase [Paenibacillus glycinis]
MKAVMVMFDSLNRHMLPNYGGEWLRAPNFGRLSEKTVTFDNCYAGSLPCMPARRELHTGRHNFLHRSWGPLEPYDDSMVDILRRKGIYTHLATDHTHYFEDGGATYHTRFNTWEYARGQEGDPWKGNVRDPHIPESLSGPKIGGLWRQDWVNRAYLDSEEKQPLAVTFANGIEFIETNLSQDNWFLQIEAFDPHEPFFTQQKYKDLYPHAYDGKHFDWPDYGRVTQQPEEIRHAIYEYAALVSMCDVYLGRVLDLFDRHDLWRDTMLIVNTDHGFLLGEHAWWGKNIQPFYNEIARLPLFVWDPRSGARGERSAALAQTIDIAPTLLEFFGAELPPDMLGKPLGGAIGSDGRAPLREAALFGMHGGHINVTDGRYVYMRAPQSFDNGPLLEYTLMPTHMHNRFDVKELSDLRLREPFSFTKGCRTLEIPAHTFINPYVHGTLLFDLELDPKQSSPIEDTAVEARMIRLMAELMRENDAPREQFERIGIPVDGIVGEAALRQEKEARRQHREVGLGLGEAWTEGGRDAYFALRCFMPEEIRAPLQDGLTRYVQLAGITRIDETAIVDWAASLGPQGRQMLAVLKRFVLSDGE